MLSDQLAEAAKPKHTPASPAALKAFMDEFMSKSHPNPMDGRQRMVGLGGDNWIILEMRAWDGHIHISWMQILPGSERKGAGRKTLRILTAMADKHRVQMGLHAKPVGKPKIPKGKLKALYREVGFVSVGGDDMKRDPKGGVATG